MKLDGIVEKGDTRRFFNELPGFVIAVLAFGLTGWGVWTGGKAIVEWPAARLEERDLRCDIIASGRLGGRVAVSVDDVVWARSACICEAAPGGSASCYAEGSKRHLAAKGEGR